MYREDDSTRCYSEMGKMNLGVFEALFLLVCWVLRTLVILGSQSSSATIAALSTLGFYSAPQSWREHILLAHWVPLAVAAFLPTAITNSGEFLVGVSYRDLGRILLSATFPMYWEIYTTRVRAARNRDADASIFLGLGWLAERTEFRCSTLLEQWLPAPKKTISPPPADLPLDSSPPTPDTDSPDTADGPDPAGSEEENKDTSAPELAEDTWEPAPIPREPEDEVGPDITDLLKDILPERTSRPRGWWKNQKPTFSRKEDPPAPCPCERSKGSKTSRLRKEFGLDSACVPPCPHKSHAATQTEPAYTEMATQTEESLVAAPEKTYSELAKERIRRWHIEDADRRMARRWYRHVKPVTIFSYEPVDPSPAPVEPEIRYVLIEAQPHEPISSAVAAPSSSYSHAPATSPLPLTPPPAPVTAPLVPAVVAPVSRSGSPSKHGLRAGKRRSTKAKALQKKPESPHRVSKAYPARPKPAALRVGLSHRPETDLDVDVDVASPSTDLPPVESPVGSLVVSPSPAPVVLSPLEETIVILDEVAEEPTPEATVPQEEVPTPTAKEAKTVRFEESVVEATPKPQVTMEEPVVAAAAAPEAVNEDDEMGGTECPSSPPLSLATFGLEELAIEADRTQAAEQQGAPEPMFTDSLPASAATEVSITDMLMSDEPPEVDSTDTMGTFQPNGNFDNGFDMGFQAQASEWQVPASTPMEFSSQSGPVWGQDCNMQQQDQGQQLADESDLTPEMVALLASLGTPADDPRWAWVKQDQEVSWGIAPQDPNLQPQQQQQQFFAAENNFVPAGPAPVAPMDMATASEESESDADFLRQIHGSEAMTTTPESGLQGELAQLPAQQQDMQFEMTSNVAPAQMGSEFNQGGYSSFNIPGLGMLPPTTASPSSANPPPLTPPLGQTSLPLPGPVTATPQPHDGVADFLVQLSQAPPASTPQVEQQPPSLPPTFPAQALQASPEQQPRAFLNNPALTSFARREGHDMIRPIPPVPLFNAPSPAPAPAVPTASDQQASQVETQQEQQPEQEQPVQQQPDVTDTQSAQEEAPAPNADVGMEDPNDWGSDDELARRWINEPSGIPPILSPLSDVGSKRKNPEPTDKGSDSDSDDPDSDQSRYGHGARVKYAGAAEDDDVPLVPLFAPIPPEIRAQQQLASQVYNPGAQTTLTAGSGGAITGSSGHFGMNINSGPAPPVIHSTHEHGDSVPLFAPRPPTTPLPSTPAAPVTTAESSSTIAAPDIVATSTFTAPATTAASSAMEQTPSTNEQTPSQATVMGPPPPPAPAAEETALVLSSSAVVLSTTSSIPPSLPSTAFNVGSISSLPTYTFTLPTNSDFSFPQSGVHPPRAWDPATWGIDPYYVDPVYLDRNAQGGFAQRPSIEDTKAELERAKAKVDAHFVANPDEDTRGTTEVTVEEGPEARPANAKTMKERKIFKMKDRPKKKNNVQEKKTDDQEMKDDGQAKDANKEVYGFDDEVDWNLYDSTP